MKFTVVVLLLLLGHQAAVPDATVAQRLARPSYGALLIAPAVLQPSGTGRHSIEPEDEGLDPVMASGLFLGVIGMLGGAAVAGTRGAECDRECRTHTGAVGATTGAALMIPIGAHIGNRNRGNLLLSILAASAIGAAGFGAASLLPGRPVAAAVFLTAPIQVVMAAKIERWTEPDSVLTTK
jgi:hypothetical protein